MAYFPSTKRSGGAFQELEELATGTVVVRKVAFSTLQGAADEIGPERSGLHDGDPDS